MKNNENHQHQTPPPPAPQPLCAVYAPLLPLLRVDELDAEQAGAVRKHVADCAWCQAKLATHAIVGDALRRHFGSGHVDVSPTFTLETIMHASQHQSNASEADAADTHILPGTAAPPITSVPPRRAAGRLTSRLAIAAILLIALLTSILLALQGGLWRTAAPHPTPTASLDAQTQAYVNVLQTDYLPFSQAASDEDHQCHGPVNAAPVAQQPALIQACRPLEVSALRTAQTLLARLQVTSPPPRWRTADSELKQAIQGYIAFYTERINAINAHDVNRFVAAWQELALPVDPLFCSSFGRFTTDLRNAGVPAVNLQDLQPFDPAYCASIGN